MKKHILLVSMLLVALPLRAEASCPVINGVYRSGIAEVDGVRGHYEQTMKTKVNRGVFSYLGGLNPETYYPADGVARPGRIRGVDVMIRFTCEPGGTLLMEQQPISKDALGWTRFKILNRNEIEILTNSPGQNGIYRRQ